ncbi:hypothetical protein HanIR_Chr13g0655171 [Helianthus annuus]|nr:hypothetical protein HanIR_Chr13g0655171 [Helianthus annuus]
MFSVFHTLFMDVSWVRLGASRKWWSKARASFRSPKCDPGLGLVGAPLMSMDSSFCVLGWWFSICFGYL